jgi:hypothetical protein
MTFGATARPFVMSSLLCLALGAGGTASALEPVAGEVILTVTGAIEVTNAEGAAVFDLAALESLETATFDTSTIWTEGVQSFEGVELVELLAAVGAEGSLLRAVALNDYAVDIPMEDAVEGGALLAFLRNGETMSLREKGPLWIVYPYDSAAAFQTEEIYARSIWQLDRIEVLP